MAPVAPVASRLFTDMATTFEAISRDPAALEASIAESPSTLAVGTDSLTVLQPFLADVTTLGQQLTPATAELEATLPVLNPAIEAGTRTLARTPCSTQTCSRCSELFNSWHSHRQRTRR